MKYIYCLLLVTISAISIAQNWNLLDENKTYFYKHSDSLLITNTIKIDSTVNSALDSVFHIHTTIKVCDTCTVIPSEAIGGVLYHVYAPEIFGHTLNYNVSTNDYQFSDGIIKQDAELSDTWIFNASLSINATVVDKYETTLFGSLDSIKVIELSTLDTILISKYHGVIRYPDFENPGKHFLLCGFHEGQNSYGEYLPNARRTYDFQTGDIFCYRTDTYSGGTFEHIHNDIEIKILDVLTHDDTIAYTARIIVSGVTSYWGPPEENPWQPYNTIWSDLKTLYLVDDARISENTYKGLFNPPAYTMDFATIVNYQFYTTLESWGYSSSLLSPAEDIHFFSPMVIDYQMSNYFGYIRRIRPFHLLNDSLGYYSSLNSQSFDLRAEGVGKLYSEVHDFEATVINKLVGFVIDGDTTGTIFNFPEDLGVHKEPNTSILIYPNPATSEINLPENLQRISFINLRGQQVLSTENPNQTIFIGDLPKGIYLVQAIDANGNLSTTKLIIE